MKNVINKIQYKYILSFAIGFIIGTAVFYYKLTYLLISKIFHSQILLLCRQLIQLELIVILSTILFCIIKNSVNKKNKNIDSDKEYIKCYVAKYIIVGGIVSILLELIFTNLTEGTGTVIAAIIAICAVYFTISENQKMRVAETITRSRIDWMQLVRKFIHEYIGYLNELENTENLSDRKKISIKLYTARDKIISYLNPEAGYVKSKNSKSKMCESFIKLNCDIEDKCDPDCVLIKELKKLENRDLNIKEHKQQVIKVTRCYFKAEWERAKWEGYTGNILKDKTNDKFDFKKEFKNYYNQYENSN